MPVATDSQTLVASAKCYSCVGYLSESQLLKLGLLKTILNQLNPMAATDPQTLINLANCYSCVSNASMGDLLELGLLQLIANNAGSGSGMAQFLFGIVDPTTPPPTPASAAFFFNHNNGRFWIWNPTTHTWEAYVLFTLVA